MMEKAIALYQKSLEESAAQADAENARARATEATERVITARESEVAKRRRTVEVMMAEKAADETRITAEAENVLTVQARDSLFRRKLLDRIEGIVRESVKPMEKIEGIRIMSFDGLNGPAGGGGGRSATDEVIDSALRYRVQAPLIDSILSEIGIEGGSLSKMGGLIREARDMAGIRKETAPKSDPKPARAAGRPRKVDATWRGFTSPR